MKSLTTRVEGLEKRAPKPEPDGPIYRMNTPEEAAEVLAILDECGALTPANMRANGWPEDLIADVVAHQEGDR